MGPVVSAIAFPAPRPTAKFYAELLKRPDLILDITTSLGEKIPALHIVVEGSKYTILYSHGNAEDLGCIMDDVDQLASVTGCSVLAYEYVGYSLSHIDDEGRRPSEAGCIRSVDAAYQYLTNELGVAACRVVCMGSSIGSGPTVDIASRKECAGCVLICPIASGVWALMGRSEVEGRTTSCLLWALDLFRNYEKIGRIVAPTAILHGTADSVVPVTNGRHLVTLLQTPCEPLYLEGYDHNNLPKHVVFQYAAEVISSLPAPYQGLDYDTLQQNSRAFNAEELPISSKEHDTAVKSKSKESGEFSFLQPDDFPPR